MAYGGSHSSYHHHRHSRRGISIPLLVISVVITIVLMLMKEDAITGKTPLKQNFEVQQYLHDDSGYFSDPEELISGLQYLHEKTNVQMVVMTTKTSYSNSETVEIYNSLFSDEGHVLVIVNTSFLSNTTYYAIGDIAGTVVDHTAMKYLLDGINSSNSGEKWNRCLRELADKLIS